MILPDINLLVYAHNEAAPHHRRAWDWWRELMSGPTPVALPWAVIFGFVRLLTHPSVLEKPLAPHEALERVESWFEQDHVLVLDPGPRHLSIVRGLFATRVWRAAPQPNRRMH